MNLEARFGRRYRIGLEGNGATKGQWPREDWPWLMELRCHAGTGSPWGGELLQAFTDKPRVGAKLRALPCVIHARGDEETVVRFHVDHIEAVLAILKPYRRRQLSQAEKKRLAAMGERFRFGEAHGVQSEHGEISGTNAAGNDRQATHPLPLPPTAAKGAANAVC